MCILSSWQLITHNSKLITKKLLFESVVVLFLFFFRILDRYLGKLEGSQCFCQDRTRSEIDSCLLDERVLIFFLGEGTLSAKAYLKGTEVALAHVFAIMNGFLHHIFQRDEQIGRAHV